MQDRALPFSSCNRDDQPDVSLVTQPSEETAMNTFATIQRRFAGFSLVVAPLLFAASTFFWHDGEYTVVSATLIVLSLFFWIPAFTGLFSLLEDKMPSYAVWGLWVAVYGCIAGCCFAFVGYLTSIFHISHGDYLQALTQHPVTSQLLLFAAGPLFPLSILLLGIQLIRAKAVMVWIGILFCLGAIAFPVSRIPRVELIAHIADFLLLVPAAYVGIVFMHNKNSLVRL